MLQKMNSYDRTKENDIMRIGQMIKNLRKEHEMTQEELADVFSVTRQTISNWENEKSYPDLQTLVDMSDRFEISLDVMLKEDGSMVKRIDKDRKILKCIKVGVLVILVIAVILCVIWTIIWYDTKKEVQMKFQKGLQQYGFVVNESEDSWQYPYIMELEDGLTFKLDELQISAWYEFNRYCVNQSLVCNVQQEEQLLEILWYGEECDLLSVDVYDKNGKHTLTEQESKKLLRDDEQLKDARKKAIEICDALYINKYN